MAQDNSQLLGRVEVQNTPDGVPFTVATTIALPNPLPTEDVSDGTPGAAAPATALQVAGTDGTDLRALSTDAAGVLNVNAAIGPGPFSVTQGTSPWVVSQDASSNPWIIQGIVGAVQSGAWTVAATQSGAWVVSLASTTITGTVAVTQSTSPWVVSLASTTITGTVAATQSGVWSVTATQGTSPWVVSMASTTITGTVAVTQSTSPWVVSLASTTITGTVAVTQSGAWTVAVTLPVTATIPTGQAKIAVTSTAVQIDTSSVALTQGIVLTARLVNSASLWIGGSGVQNGFNPGTDIGYELFPGASVVVPANNANLLYMNGAAGDGLTWIGA